MLQRCYHLSPRSRLERRDGALWLRCDHPLQSIALNESAGRLLDALRPGVPLSALARGIDVDTVDLLDGLALRGALRADYRLEPAADPPPVDVVVPAYGASGPLRRCLDALAAQRYPAGRVRVTVVDDASPVPLQATLGEVPGSLVLRWLRLERNAGPASARNAGAFTPWPGAAPHPWLAFVDADCVPDPDWLAGLAALLEDPLLHAAGGTVRGLRHQGLLARYEDACSSLYLGERPGPVSGPDAPLAYLPSCNLAVRRDAFQAVGGFREGWRFGEDVDLCWRLHATGRRLFYHPAPAVAHDHRTRWGPFAARRWAYGRSEALLRASHPGHFGPLLQPGPALFLASLGAALGTGWALAWGLAGVAALGMAAVPLWRGLRGGPPARWPPGTLAAAGLRRAAGQLVQQARRLNRQGLALWAPLLMLLVAGLPPGPQAGLTALGALGFGAGALGEWRARRPRLRVGTFLAGYGAECLAYSLGRTQGQVGRAWRHIRGGPATVHHETGPFRAGNPDRATRGR